VQREVENMNIRDLKEKIVKISQLYKSERIKSRELEKTIKVMEPQISNSMQLNSIIAAQKNQNQILSDRLEKISKDN
jgi:predicted oxidoreductase